MPTTSSSALSTRPTPVASSDEMRKRLQEFALSLHPEKTRLIEFGRFAADKPQAARARQTGDLQLPGLHSYLRQISPGQVPDQTEDPAGSHAGEAARRSKRNCDGACISRSPSREDGWSRSSPATSPTTRCRRTVRSLTAFRIHVTDLWLRTLRRRSQKDANDLGADHAAGRRLAPATANPSSLARAALRRHTPEVGAVCRNSARTDLCGLRLASALNSAV